MNLGSTQSSETDRKPINRFSIVLGLDLDFDCLGGKSSDSTHVSHVCLTHVVFFAVSQKTEN